MRSEKYNITVSCISKCAPKFLKVVWLCIAVTLSSPFNPLPRQMGADLVLAVMKMSH